MDDDNNDRLYRLCRSIRRYDRSIDRLSSTMGAPVVCGTDSTEGGTGKTIHRSVTIHDRLLLTIHRSIVHPLPSIAL